MTALPPFSRWRACDKCECGFIWREATLDAKATNHAPAPTTDSPEAQGDGG